LVEDREGEGPVSGKKLGATAALLVTLIAAYEFLAILTPLSTWSRHIQGIRDVNDILYVSVIGFTVLLCGTATWFSAWWLPNHFIRDERSSL
jgi:hypothetical protein